MLEQSLKIFGKWSDTYVVWSSEKFRQYNMPSNICNREIQKIANLVNYTRQKISFWIRNMAARIFGKMKAASKFFYIWWIRFLFRKTSAAEIFNTRNRKAQTSLR